MDLQKEYKKAISELSELRNSSADNPTDEQVTSFEGAVEKVERLRKMIDTEERAKKLMEKTETKKEEVRTLNVEVPDAPIYRGKYQLGQQLRDIIVTSSPSLMSSPQAQEARSRMEQVENRSRAINTRAAGTGQIESVGSDGGFLLQTESSIDLINKGFNNSELLSRCTKRTLTSANSVELIGMNESSRADGSRGGGVRVYTNAELDQMTSSKTSFEKIKIEPKKLTGLFYASDEILQDVAMLEQEMSSLFAKEFAFKTQDLILNGSGSGEPLGILNAPSLISVAKETGQAASTIVTENILKMRSRLWSGSLNNYVWIANQDCQEQLYTMSLDVGTGGLPVFMPANGLRDDSFDRLFNKPIIFVEQAQTVGTLGDLYCVDLSQYIVADKGGVDGASSIHFKFDYNQTTFRFTYRFDGQPRWSSALTPYKGTNTVSPFVALAARA